MEGGTQPNSDHRGCIDDRRRPLRPVHSCAIKLAVVMTVQLHSFSGGGLDCQPNAAGAARRLRTVRVLDDHSGLRRVPVNTSTAIGLSANIGKALTCLAACGRKKLWPWHVKSPFRYSGNCDDVCVRAALGTWKSGDGGGRVGGRARESLRGAWPRGVHRRGWFLLSWVRVEQSHSEDGIGGMGHAFNQIARII